MWYRTHCGTGMVPYATVARCGHRARLVSFCVVRGRRGVRVGRGYILLYMYITSILEPVSVSNRDPIAQPQGAPQDALQRVMCPNDCVVP